MIDRQTTKQGRRPTGDRGAALVVSIAIMTILLAVGLTFYAISRTQVDNATNVRNAVQNDLHVDTALAIAMAELNRDFLKRPNATSFDAPPFALFDGRWAVGKQWALRNGVPLQAGGVPLVDLSAMTDIRYPDGHIERLFTGRSKDWLTIPRFEGSNPYAYDLSVTDLGTGLPLVPFRLTDDGENGRPNRPPFVTPAFFGPGFADDNGDGNYGLEGANYPLEWIHTWTDVDNDGDGLNDAIWIPLPQDRFFSGGEIVDDITGRRMFDDFADNDLDGMVDENQENGINEDLANEAVAAMDDADEAMELGSFVYHGLGIDQISGDGLDNDGNGLIDDAAEDKYFLTSPLPGLTILIDLNADGLVPDRVPNEATGELEPLRVVLPNQITVLTAGGPVTLGPGDVDRLDNDLDMMVNDYNVYCYVGPNTNDGVANGPRPPFQFLGIEETGIPTEPFQSIERPTAYNSDPAVLNSNYYDNWLLTGNWFPGDTERFRTARLKAYDEINVDSVIGRGNVRILPASSAYYSPVLGRRVTGVQWDNVLSGQLRITHSGEPVCDLAGRAAITIRDEASKVNMNVAGAHQYDPLLPVLNDFSSPTSRLRFLSPAIYRALGQGASPAEYETRILPGTGVVEAAQFWLQRTGVPAGNPATIWDPSVTAVYGSDVIYPGYGRVDDNANAMMLALNGRDDDGDGLIDEGLFLPELSPNAEAYLRGAAGTNVAAAQDELLFKRYPEYFAQLGAFEGVDEPGELQRYLAAPNLQAEGRNPYNITGALDTIDNDGDGAVNERGELGDLQLQDTLQIQDIDQIGAGTYNTLRQSLSAFSTDRNVNFVAGNAGIRALNKLDFNFATPQQIAANLVLSGGFESVTASGVSNSLTTNRFAEGLKQGDIHLRAGFGGLMDGTSTRFPADPVLQAMQAAVDIVDNRDPGHGRSLLTTERMKSTPPDALEDGVFDFFPTSLGVRERIEEDEVFPLGTLEDYLKTNLDVTRKLEIRDDWWSEEAGVAGVDGDREQRVISYTTSGNEAVRINELMVRAVRRIEAEAVPNPAGPFGVGDPMTPPIVVPVATPVENFDPTPFGNGGNPNILPEFNVARRAQPGWVLNNGGTLGDASWLETDVAGSTLQFRISASNLVPQGLPQGRYYLMVDLSGTALPVGGGIEYSIKYDNGTDIIDNAAGAQFAAVPALHLGANVPGAPNDWAFLNGTVPPTAAGYFIDGGGYLPDPGVLGNLATHTVTVPPQGAPTGDLLIGIRMTLPVGATGILRVNALDFSQEPDHEWVELVNVSDDVVNVGGWELEVGIPFRPSVPDDPFKSNWKIPLGTEIAPRGMVLLAFNKYDRFQYVGPVPNGVPGITGLIGANGIGLADGDTYNQLLLPGLLTGNLTVPPIGDNSNIPAATTPALLDPTGSVFRREAFVAGQIPTDYIDWDGDGRTALNYTVDTDNLANDALIASSKELGSFLGGGGGNLPWDRIIQLEEFSQLTADNPFTASPSARRLMDVSSVDHVAALVLRGGALPNYPERDGYDNDGDGGYVLFEQRDERTQASGGNYDVGGAGFDTFPDWIDASEVPGVPYLYVPGILDLDMLDNNFNGYVDERPFQDDPYLLGVESSFYRAYLSEGVDEGRGLFNNIDAVRRFGAGSFEAGILPFGVFPDRQDWNTAFPNTFDPNPPFSVITLGSNNDNLQYAINSGINVYGDPIAIPGAIPTSYHGSDADPADWKAFSERRWYPGDNVIVTLYEGRALDGEVVDRVTYREQDVINRTIDDVGPIPYVAVDLDLSGTPGDSLIEVPGVNPNYPSMWLPNHMGLDWYRSLERKHPLYNGDRFGTTNRWEATDGNYDDWADSLSFFEGEIVTDPRVLPFAATDPLLLMPDQVGDVRPRFVGTHPAFPNVDIDTLRRNNQLFAHAINASPLRMNATARRSENPRDLELIELAAADVRQFPSRPNYSGPFDYVRTHEDNDFSVTGSPSLPDQRWNHSRTTVANRPYQSNADLMRVPHQMYLHDAVNTAGGDAFLRDMTMLNYHVQSDSSPGDGISVTQELALRGTSLGQDSTERLPLGAPNLLSAAVNSMAIDTVVLTMGQAEFRPIRPDAPAVSGTPALLNWVENLATGDPVDLIAPAAWTPVFLFGLGSDAPGPNLDHFPNYPTYVNGANATEVFSLRYLFNTNYLSNVGNFGGVNVYNNVPDDRWPLEKRTAMFVSEYRPDVTPQRAEALFVWDGADGLENGEYVVYIGTFLPQMRERVEAAARDSAQVGTIPAMSIQTKAEKGLASYGVDVDVDYVLPDGTTVLMDWVTNSILTRDPTNPRALGQVFDPVYAIDVITNPTEAQGEAPLLSASPSDKPAGLIHPDDWQPTVQYKAGPDGYIFYGNSASGGWQPQIVRVTDNFLALRVRNLGAPGQVGALTHIVLAPRKRTAGRVNVNTVQPRVFRSGPGDEYFSTLLGIPGMVDIARTVQPRNGAGVLGVPIPPDADLALLSNATANLPPDGSWTAPGGGTGFYPVGFSPPQRNQRDPDIANPDFDLLVPNNPALTPEERHQIGSFRGSAMLMAGRTEFADGRYYPSVGALVSDNSAFDYDYVNSRADVPDLSDISGQAGPADTGTLGVENWAIYPLSNDADPARRFDEVRARLQRMGNTITVRSDVFEIIMTVESGYGVDRNNDGFINYRDPNEFTTTASTRASATYERRAPSDLSDSAE